MATKILNGFIPNVDIELSSGIFDELYEYINSPFAKDLYIFHSDDTILNKIKRHMELISSSIGNKEYELVPINFTDYGSGSGYHFDYDEIKGKKISLYTYLATNKVVIDKLRHMYNVEIPLHYHLIDAIEHGTTFLYRGDNDYYKNEIGTQAVIPTHAAWNFGRHSGGSYGLGLYLTTGFHYPEDENYPDETARFYGKLQSDILKHGNADKGCSKNIIYNGVSLGNNVDNYKNVYGLFIERRPSHDVNTSMATYLPLIQEWNNIIKKAEPFDFFISVEINLDEVVFIKPNVNLIYSELIKEPTNVCMYSGEHTTESHPIECRQKNENQIRNKPCTQCEILRSQGKLPINKDGTQIVWY